MSPRHKHNSRFMLRYIQDTCTSIFPIQYTLRKVARNFLQTHSQLSYRGWSILTPTGCKVIVRVMTADKILADFGHRLHR